MKKKWVVPKKKHDSGTQSRSFQRKAVTHHTQCARTVSPDKIPLRYRLLSRCTAHANNNPHRRWCKAGWSHPPALCAKGLEASPYFPQLHLNIKGQIGWLVSGSIMYWHCSCSAILAQALTNQTEPQEGAASDAHWALTDAFFPLQCSTACDIFFPCEGGNTATGLGYA